MKKIIFAFGICLTLIQVHAQEKLNTNDLKKLHKRMQGFYSSNLQSLNDSAYYDIRLKMIPMWKDREGYWLYVEQAMSTSEEKPYRQRVYHLIQLNETTIESQVYTIKSGEKYYGDWKKRKPLKNVPFDSLEIRKGCSIFLRKNKEGNFVGSTHESDCESSLRGASYATSEVTIGDDMVKSWDRGFDKDKKQVWGAVKGAYEFIKMEE
jgi:CpeT protein